MHKKQLFEYFLYLLIDWYKESYGYDNILFEQNNDLSKLKVFKLHFFASSTSSRALEIFNNFHALPYGHVESDVYRMINHLDFFSITNTKILFKQDIGDIDLMIRALDTIDIETIDGMVEKLKKYNQNLIRYSAFDLVELSHKWFSWKFSFERAKRLGLFSMPIENKLILTEAKYYSF